MRAASVCLLLGLAMALHTGCSEPTPEKWPWSRNEELVRRSPLAEWRPIVSYSADRHAVEVQMNTMCMNFHLETPEAGQAFTQVEAGQRDLPGVVAEMYEQYVNLAAYGFPVKWLTRGRELFIVGNSKLTPVMAELAQIIGDPALAQIEPTADKEVMDSVFQWTEWRVTDQLTGATLPVPERASAEEFRQLGVPSDTAKRLAELKNRMIDVMLELDRAMLHLADDVLVEARGLLALTLPPPAAADESTPQDLLAARSQGLVRVDVSSTGGFRGRTLLVRVQASTAAPLRLEIPNGLRLSPDSGGGAALMAAGMASRKSDASGLLGMVEWRLPPGRLGQLTFPLGASVQSMQGASSVPFTLNAPEEIDPVRGTASAGEERTMTVVVGGQQRIVDYTNLPTFNDPDGRTMRTLRMMGGTVVKIYIDPLLEAMRGSEGQFRDIVHDNADAILAAVALLTEGYGSANPPQERCQDFTLTVDGPGGAKCDLQVSTCADKDPGGGVVATIEQASLGDCR